MTVYADIRFQNRRRRLASTLAGQRIDAMLVTHLTHVRFLSGFSGSNGAVLVKKDLTALISTDGRYTTRSGKKPLISTLSAHVTAGRLCWKRSTAPVG